MGSPGDVPSKAERKSEKELALWSKDVLATLVEHTGALYGSIGVEVTLPTPSHLRTGGDEVGSELFVSTALVTENPRLVMEADNDYREGTKEERPSGLFYSRRWCGNSVSESVPSSRTRNALARAARRVVAREG
ncbi:hypothetical protein [Haloactinospora alba]|uniref:hypothetical protein n=1 Tax=Haloactinospora alba TaxID=405555 RepID=UPI0011540C25|nr:hypothetical protein [Haloactinospora alba]